MDPTTPCLMKAFKNIKEHHRQSMYYTFDDMAMEVFIEAHDSLGERKKGMTHKLLLQNTIVLYNSYMYISLCNLCNYID